MTHCVYSAPVGALLETPAVATRLWRLGRCQEGPHALVCKLAHINTEKKHPVSRNNAVVLGVVSTTEDGVWLPNFPKSSFLLRICIFGLTLYIHFHGRHFDLSRQEKYRCKVQVWPMTLMMAQFYQVSCQVSEQWAIPEQRNELD